MLIERWPPTLLTAPSVLTLAVITATCALGCKNVDQGSAARNTEAFRVADSAGIQIVHNAAPALGETEGWSIDPEPVLQIGQVQGDPAYEFAQIWNATRLADGRIVVSDGKSFEIRVFGPNGSHLSTFGGQGAGPGEFGGPPWLTAASDETIIVWDPGHYRFSWFDAGGSLLGDTSLVSMIQDLEIVRFVNGLVWQLAPEGSLLSTGPVPVSMRSGEGLEGTARRIVLIRDRGESVHAFGDFPSGQSFITLRADGIKIGIGNPWFPRNTFALGADRAVAIGGDKEWEIRLHDPNGSLQRIVRAEIARTPVTSETLEAERDRLPELAERMGIPLGQAREAFDRLPVPDSVPAIGAIHWDRAGNLWVGRRSEERRVIRVYDIFDPNGRWITSVATPPDVARLLEIDETHFITSYTDELGVPYLRVNRIVKRPELGDSGGPEAFD